MNSRHHPSHHANACIQLVRHISLSSETKRGRRESDNVHDVIEVAGFECTKMK